MLVVQKIQKFILTQMLVTAWKETKPYKKIQNVFTTIVKHAKSNPYFLSGKFKNTVMSFKIGFVQRHLGGISNPRINEEALGRLWSRTT
jgi:hypothetical protein